MSTEIQNTQTALAQMTASSFLNVMLQDSGKGCEEATASDCDIPRIYLTQASSAVLQENASAPNARAGTFYNTVSGEFWSKFKFIPVEFKKRYAKYLPDGTFDGYLPFNEVELNRVPNARVGRQGLDYVLVDDKGTSSLVDTRMHYVLAENPNTGAYEPAIISLSRTQIKASKRLITLVKTNEMRAPDGRTFVPASWAMVYECSAVQQSNDRGRWFGWNFARVAPVEDRDLYFKGQSFHNVISEQDVQISAPTAETDAGAFHAQQMAREAAAEVEDPDTIPF